MNCVKLWYYQQALSVKKKSKPKKKYHRAACTGPSSRRHGAECAGMAGSDFSALWPWLCPSSPRLVEDAKREWLAGVHSPRVRRIALIVGGYHPVWRRGGGGDPMTNCPVFQALGSELGIHRGAQSRKTGSRRTPKVCLLRSSDAHVPLFHRKVNRRRPKPVPSRRMPYRECMKDKLRIKLEAMHFGISRSGSYTRNVKYQFGTKT